MVIEQTATPLDWTKFKEKADYTIYVQKPNISKKMVENLPDNSVFKLKNTSVNDTPMDEDII